MSANPVRRSEGLTFRDWFRESQGRYLAAGISLWDVSLWYRSAWLPPDSEREPSLEALETYWNRQYEDDLSPQEGFLKFLEAMVEEPDFDFGPPYPRLIEANYILAVEYLRAFWDSLLDFEYMIMLGSDLEHSLNNWFPAFQRRLLEFIEREKGELEAIARAHPEDIVVSLKRPREGYR